MSRRLLAGVIRQMTNIRFPDPGRDLSGKFRNALGPLFGDWVFSHFEKAIAVLR